MPLLLIAIAISSVFSAVIIKTTDYEKKIKQPITNRRHNSIKSKLLDINKDLSIQSFCYIFERSFLKNFPKILSLYESTTNTLW